jgi:hypothetical protein
MSTIEQLAECCRLFTSHALHLLSCLQGGGVRYNTLITDMDVYATSELRRLLTRVTLVSDLPTQSIFGSYVAVDAQRCGTSTTTTTTFDRQHCSYGLCTTSLILLLLPLLLLLLLNACRQTNTCYSMYYCYCVQVMGDTLLHLSRAAFEDYAAYITQCAAARVVIVSPANVRVTRPTPRTGSQTGSQTGSNLQSPPLFKVALQKSAVPVGAGTYVFEYDSPPEAYVAAVLATFDAAVQVSTHYCCSCYCIQHLACMSEHSKQCCVLRRTAVQTQLSIQSDTYTAN